MIKRETGAASIDWAGLHARMEKAKQATKAASDPHRARAGRILETRAHALATPRDVSVTPAATIDVLPLVIGGASYLIESRFVCELVRTPVVAAVPRAPAFVAGLMNRRGQLLPVFDLAFYLGLADVRNTTIAALAILGTEAAEFAIIVTGVEPARRIASGSICHPAGVEEKHIYGLANDGSPLLDGSAILADPRLILKS